MKTVGVISLLFWSTQDPYCFSWGKVFDNRSNNLLNKYYFQQGGFHRRGLRKPAPGAQQLRVACVSDLPFPSGVPQISQLFAYQCVDVKFLHFFVFLHQE